MSTLLQKIKEDQVAARKGGDKFEATVLTTLLGEAGPSGTQEVTDEDVQGTVVKFIKNIEGVIGFTHSSDTQAKMRREVEILEKYLPKQLTEDELRVIIVNYIKYHHCDTVGDVMKMLKQEYDKRYDGRTASQIAKRNLG